MKIEEKECPCKRVKCERHGHCDECQTHHHHGSRKPLTACDRMKEKAERKLEREQKIAKRRE